MLYDIILYFGHFVGRPSRARARKAEPAACPARPRPYLSLSKTKQTKRRLSESSRHRGERENTKKSARPSLARSYRCQKHGRRPWKEKRSGSFSALKKLFCLPPPPPPFEFRPGLPRAARRIRVVPDTRREVKAVDEYRCVWCLHHHRHLRVFHAQWVQNDAADSRLFWATDTMTPFFVGMILPLITGCGQRPLTRKAPRKISLLEHCRSHSRRPRTKLRKPMKASGGSLSWAASILAEDGSDVSGFPSNLKLRPGKHVMCKV